jgi:hypothetical protein
VGTLPPTLQFQKSILMLMRFPVLTEANSSGIWRHSLVHTDVSQVCTVCHIRVMMEALHTSETSVYFCETTLRHISEEYILNNDNARLLIKIWDTQLRQVKASLSAPQHQTWHGPEPVSLVHIIITYVPRIFKYPSQSSSKKSSSQNSVYISWFPKLDTWPANSSITG